MFAQLRKSANIAETPINCAMVGPRRIPVELRIQPGTRAFVLSEGADLGTGEKVRVYENHLNDSPSAIARTSAILSTFAARHGPRSTERVRNTRRFFSGAIMHFKPSRRTWFISALNFTPRRFSKRFSDAATLSSGVIVVRAHQA
jgi:hypothetical protein